MTAEGVKIRCRIIEIRRSGEIPVVLQILGNGHDLTYVPRSAVEITSLVDGISGRVKATVIEELGDHLLVEIPIQSRSPLRASVSRDSLA